MRPAKNPMPTIPEVAPDGQPPQKEPEVSSGGGAEASPSPKPYTIMVVEDFDDTRAMLRRALQMNGYRVVEASNGLEAVDLVRRGCPDLILMDLNMPVMDGLEATERIRECLETRKDVVILAITAHDTYGMREAALEAGCDGYIKKPIDFDRLDTTILNRLLPTAGRNQ
jgi:two-component system, cell cycle response regulator DivK